MKDNVTVSIVIPSREEEQYIEKCLLSIIDQTYPKNLLSVFVCDGMSHDQTRAIVESYAVSYPYIHLLSNTTETTPHALNLGIQASDSDVVIILSAHAEMKPDYIVNCVRELSLNDSVGCVGGIIENVFENETSSAIGRAMSSSFGVGNSYFRTGLKEGYTDTVVFGAYPRKIFTDVGYFDEEFVRNQDDEFSYRILKSGYKILLKKSIQSKYYVRSSFTKLFHQYFAYGFWKVYVNKKHKTITTWRQVVPFCFVFLLSLSALMPFIPSLLLLIYACTILLYVLLSILFAFSGKGIKHTLKTVLAFYTLHFSYGVGYGKGILYFLFLGKNAKTIKQTMSR